MFDPQFVRKDFLILARKINGKPLVYLDSAATAQKPRQVLEAEREYYERHNANVHRGAHTLGDEATSLYAEARQRVAKFIGAQHAEEIVFVRNTTEAINLVAYVWGAEHLKLGDVIVATMLEHHANLVPWQQAAIRQGATVKVAGIADDGTVDMDDYKAKLKLKPKLVAFTHVSNTLGTINPVAEMTKLAHRAGALVLIDGAQAVPHMSVNVAEIGCDFYAFSGHKMLGPMGIGVLWGRKEILEQMPPFLTGGGMIDEVYTDHATWAPIPEKFEAGTPNVSGAVGLMSAIDYLEKLGMENVREHDRELTAYCLQQLAKIKEVKILGKMDVGQRAGSVAFVYEGVHAHDVATILDSQGVAIRSGHHCTMPLHTALGVAASARASFNVYTTKSEIDDLIEAIGKIKKVFTKK